MAADVLSTQGVKASPVMVLIELYQNIPILLSEGLTHCGLVMPYRHGIDLGQYADADDILVLHHISFVQIWWF